MYRREHFNKIIQEYPEHPVKTLVNSLRKDGGHAPASAA
jgi:hypothetical protein